MHRQARTMTVAETVKAIIIEELGLADHEVTPEAKLYGDGRHDDLGCDDLDLVELMMAFEAEYGIEIPDADAAGIVTVGDAIAYLERRLSERQASR